MYDYLVLTAAVTRPALHRLVFPGNLALLGGARVKWLINVDDIGTGASLAETQDNLRRLLAADNVDVEFLGGDAPCFFQAARRLTERAHALLDECRIGVLWLEDDWLHRPRSPAQSVLMGLRLQLAANRAGRRIGRCPGTLAEKAELLAGQSPQSRWFVSLVPRSRVSFNPGIWSKALFEEALWRPLQQPEEAGPADPEARCADPLNEPSRYAGLTVLVDPLYQDVGREWSAACGAAKWSKDACDGAVTYRAGQRRARVSLAEARVLSGWIEIRHPRTGTGVALIGRIECDGERLTARLLGVPQPRFELQIVEPGEAQLYLHRAQAWARTYPFKKLPVQVHWRIEEGVTFDVDDAGRRLEARLNDSLPWRAIWIGPLQCLVGLVWLLVTLLAALRYLDAERPSRRD